MKMSCGTCGQDIASSPNYVGKLVFVERVRKPGDTEKTYSNYGGGEYLILRQTACQLYGMKYASDAYSAHTQREIPLVGDGCFQVHGVSDVSQDQLRTLTSDLWFNAHTKERGEKAQWVDYVYENAKSTARQLASLVGFTLPSYAAQSSSPFFVDRIARLEKEVSELRANLRKV